MKDVMEEKINAHFFCLFHELLFELGDSGIKRDSRTTYPWRLKAANVTEKDVDKFNGVKK